VQSEVDQAKRNAMIRGSVQDCTPTTSGHIPLHQQALAWAMKKNGEARATGRQLQMPYKWVTVK
jgi:peptide/nickel transport system substrate-binding protein